MLRILAAIVLGTTATWTPPAAAPERAALLRAFSEEFVPITPGAGQFPSSFEQGQDSDPAARPVHRVEFKRSFAIAKYEVPQNLYESVMGTNPSRWKGPRNAVDSLTWDEAGAFCRRVTALLRAEKLLGEREEIRLPFESEWEYCCRAGTTSEYSFGDQARKDGDVGETARVLDAYAWHHGNAAGNDPAVGALAPNAWGLYDMHGYLWEFCADAWQENYDGVAGQKAPGDAAGSLPLRTIRGGSWKDAFPRLRSASRASVDPGARNDAIGFRCVKSTMDVESP